MSLIELGGDPLGVKVQLLERGAAIFGVQTCDADGSWLDLAVGPETVEDFLANQACFGASCGRFANRIAGGHFSLDGKDYHLQCNNGPNSLHGGDAPFHDRDWQLIEVVEEEGFPVEARFLLESADGDGGYPGNLRVEATYRVSSNELSVVYFAQSDAPTVVNLTNHVYWNLSGDHNEAVHDHELLLAARYYHAVDADYLIVPEPLEVSGTQFDFSKGAQLSMGQALGASKGFELKGFDHAFRVEGTGLRLGAKLGHRGSGRSIELWTDQPAIHVYTGAFIDEPTQGKAGAALKGFCGVALESENLPDAPNQPDFPSAVLRPGEAYRHEIRWRFDCNFKGF